MPGRVFLTTPVADIANALSIPFSEPIDDGPRHNIAPGQNVLAYTSSGLMHMRWGLIPTGRVNARGRPVMETIINARSETVFDKSAFVDVGRAVLPVNGWYEWTGKARRKTAWRITPADAGLLFFAAITDTWNAPGGAEIHQLATVTCPPNADVEPIHHRMAVILAPDNLEHWLHGSETEVAELMRPWPEGQLTIAQADDVDWSAP